MAFAAPPLSLPGPATWWQDPKVRARLIAAAVLVAAYATGLAYGSWTRVCAAERCPSISRLIGGPGPQQTSKVYAADGRLITELGLERRTVLALNEIPLAVRQAFIATEDKRFYSHHGIDYWRIFGALKANIVTLGRSQGASTISMQLARNIFPEEISREKKITRKIKEARVAIEIESNFPKDTILQLYLNQIDLGSGAHGVAAAAQIYFGKSARQLNVAEAAMLAALPKAPAFYNPRAHPDRAVRRRNVVLSLMRDQDYITPEEAELWKAYPLVLTSNRTNYGDVAPYFVEWLRSTQLEPRFGRQLYEGGLRVYTTLDLDMQQAAERALTSQLDAIEAGVYSKEKFPGRTTYRDYMESSKASGEDHGPYTPYLQGALVAIETSSGYVLAMIPMRQSLFLSRNLSTIKLGMSLGEQTVVGEARRFGITTPLRAYPSLHIGANGVRPIEIIAAFTGFATLGTRAEPVGILRVEDRQGNILWQPLIQREQVMDPEHSWLILDMMRDVMRCQPGTGPGRCGTAAGAGAGLNVPMAGKTGTTDDYTDAWFVGFTPELVAGLWVGYDLQQRIRNNAAGGRIVAPAWTMFMRDVYDRRPTPIDWPRPDSLILKEVDWSNGTLATPFCPRELHRFEWFYPGTEPTQLCPVHTPPFGVTP